jgi:hypothetical protein
LWWALGCIMKRWGTEGFKIRSTALSSASVHEPRRGDQGTVVFGERAMGRSL